MDGKRRRLRCTYLREAAENMEKNGMMQELKCKSKCIDDFIAAEYLIAQKYTSSDLPFVGGQMEVY
jgi:hypothetical protein